MGCVLLNIFPITSHFLIRRNSIRFPIISLPLMSYVSEQTLFLFTYISGTSLVYLYFSLIEPFPSAILGNFEMDSII